MDNAIRMTKTLPLGGSKEFEYFKKKKKKLRKKNLEIVENLQKSVLPVYHSPPHGIVQYVAYKVRKVLRKQWKLEIRGRGSSVFFGGERGWFLWECRNLLILCLKFCWGW